jgi:hypothetical protein
MKGTIRERRKKDGTVVFTCQVEASRDLSTPPLSRRGCVGVFPQLVPWVMF